MSLFSARSGSHTGSLHSRGGFTLIELMIVISVFSIMMLSAFEVYSQVMFLSQRLELQREIQQSARIVSEHLAEEVRKNGFAFLKEDGTAIDTTTKKIHTQSGLVIGTESVGGAPTYRIGYFPQKIGGGSCDGNSQCQIVYIDKNNSSQALTSDRVTVLSLSFEIMGEPTGVGGAGAGINVDLSTTPKVRVLMTLEPKKGSAISDALISATRLHLDTVLSTRIYQSSN